MPLELASITKAHYKLKHKNSSLEGNSDNRKSAFRNHSMQPPYYYEELRPRLPASVGPEFPAPHLTSGSYDHNTKKQRTPEPLYPAKGIRKITGSH